MDGEQGLAGRELWVDGPVEPFWDWPPTTGPDGAVALSGLPPGEYRVSAAHLEDLQRTAAPVSVRVSEERPEAEVTLRAVRGGVILGRMVDADTGAPLPGVLFSLEETLLTGPRAPFSRSGPDGRFRLRVPPGKTRLRVRVPARPGSTEMLAVEVDVADGQDVPLEIPVRGWRVLSGRVVDAAGKPVPAAIVKVSDGAAATAAGTDKDGRFSIGGLPDGEVALTVGKGEDGLAVPLKLTPPFPTDLVVAIGPKPQAALVGRVVDDRGRPAPGVEVRILYPERSTRGISYAVAGTVTTDAEGRYRLVVRDLTREYEAHVSGRHLARGGGKPLGDAGPERRFSDLVVCSFCAAIAGKVVDAKGKPVAGALVLWTSGARQHQTATDTQGRFRIAEVPDREITLAAMDDGGRSAFARVVPGKEAVLILR